MSFKEASERLEGKNKTEQQKFMINMPCKYHKKGMCKLGKSCRFLHTNQKTKKTPAVNLPTTAEKTVCVQISKFGRRPFLQLVVLYASDARVSKYAEEILEILLDAGIDVVVQNTVQGGFSPQIGTKVPKSKDIKAEHLAELICTSHADFLIVVGDKNMKNRSCQAKRKGKLLEMMVVDVISLIWKSWPQNPHKTLARIKSLTTEQTTSILFQYCGPKHISDRFEYLCTLKKEILSTYKIGSWCDSLEDKMANLQKCAITLHKQLKKAMKVLSELVVQVENPEMSRGSEKTFEYKPSACRTPKSTIAYPLQIHLYCFIVDTMKSIEDSFEIIRLPAALWDEYYGEHVGNWNVNLEELIRIRDEMWKALEEHEKSLLSQEGEKPETDALEDGMFSDMRDEDFDNDLFSELEFKSELTGFAEDSSLQEQTDISGSRASNSQPIKYPFSFPMATTAIFTPGKKNGKDKSEEFEDRDIKESKRETIPPGIGRGSLLGRGNFPTHHKEYQSGMSDTSRLDSGWMAGMGRGLTEKDVIHRRCSTGGLDVSSELALAQRRDWASRGTNTSVPKEPGSPILRRQSDLGMIRGTSNRSFFENRGISEEQVDSRSITKEEKFLAAQLDRQLERRKDLQRQLKKEMEVERELARQLEKRKQRVGEYAGKLANDDLGAPGLSNTAHTSAAYNPFPPGAGLSSLQPQQRRPSFASATQPVISPLPLQSRLSFSLRDEDRPSRRESVSNHLDGRSPRRESISTPKDEGYLSPYNQSPRGPAYPFVSKPEPQHASFNSSYSPFHERSMREDSYSEGLSMGTTIGEEGRTTRSPSMSLPPSPRPQTPSYSADTAINSGGGMRDLTLFPSTMYGSVKKSDPYFQQISKIWGQDKLPQTNQSEVSPPTFRSYEESRENPASIFSNFSNDNSDASGDDSIGKDEGEDVSAPNSPTRRLLTPKLTLHHGFVLKPDPVAST